MTNQTKGRNRGVRRGDRGLPGRPSEVAFVRHLGPEGARLASPWASKCPASAVVALAIAHSSGSVKRLTALATVLDAVDPPGSHMGAELATLSVAVEALMKLAYEMGCIDDTPEGRWLAGWLAGELAWIRWANRRDAPWAVVDALGRPDGVSAAAVAAALARRADPALGLWSSARPTWSIAAVSGPIGAAIVGPMAVALAAIDAEATSRLLDASAVPPAAPEATWLALGAACRSGVAPDACSAIDHTRRAPNEMDRAEGELNGTLDEDWDLGIGVAWSARGVAPVLLEAMGAALNRWASWLAASSRKPQVKASEWQERWRASDVARLGAGVAAHCARHHLTAGTCADALRVLDHAPTGPYPHLSTLRALATLEVSDANDIVLPPAWPERFALAERLATVIADLDPPAAESTDPWVRRQLGSLVALMGVGRRQATAFLTWLPVSEFASSSIAYGTSLALATFEDGPLRIEYSGASSQEVTRIHRHWARIGRAALEDALREGFQAEEAEVEEIARALGVDVDIAFAWADTLSALTAIAVNSGDGAAVAALAANPGLCPAEPALTSAAVAGVTAVAYDSLVYLATLIDEDAEVVEPVENAEFSESPHQFASNAGRKSLRLAVTNEDRASIQVLTGLLAGRWLVSAAEDLIGEIEATVLAAGSRIATRTCALPPALEPASTNRYADLEPAPAAPCPPTAAPGLAVLPTEAPRKPKPRAVLKVESLVAEALDPPALTTALRELGRGPMGGVASAHLAEVLEAVSDSVCDEVWLAALEGTSSDLALPWSGGPRCDLERVRVLRRLGRVGEATTAGEILAWRVVDAGGSLAGVTSDDIETVLAGLGANVPRTSPSSTEITQTVSIVFVGGDETQARYVPVLEADLATRHAGRIMVEWVHTGWAANWQEHAARVEAGIKRADVIVLMRLMRTNLGAHLRRAASEANVPWVPCTGHGRSSILRSLEQAVAVADQRRAPRGGT